MGRPRGSTVWPPKYTKHASGQARVRIPGSPDVYLGKFNSPESWKTYYRVVAEAQSKGLASVKSDPSTITIVELTAAYWTANQEMSQAATKRHDRMAGINHLQRLYGSHAANSFGPSELKIIRKCLIDEPYKNNHTQKGFNRRTRNGINRNIKRVVEIFRWGTENGLVHGSLYHSLMAVKDLRRGEGGREPAKIEPVDDAVIEQVIPHLSPHVAAMVRLQRLTGMRSGEVCIMRVQDINMTLEPWIYVPGHHKTEHFGIERQIPLGPKAREVLAPFITSNASDFIFSPMRSFRLSMEIRAMDACAQSPYPLKAKVAYLKRKAKRKPTARRFNDHYQPHSYCSCIRYTIKQMQRAASKGRSKVADCTVPLFHPHQLRHSYATEVANTFDLPSAQHLLGHTNEKTTKIYVKAAVRDVSHIVQSIG